MQDEVEDEDFDVDAEIARIEAEASAREALDEDDWEEVDLNGGNSDPGLGNV